MRNILFFLLCVFTRSALAYDLGCNGALQESYGRWLDDASSHLTTTSHCRLAYTAHTYELEGWLPGYGRYSFSSGTQTLAYSLEQAVFARREGHMLSALYQQWQSTTELTLKNPHIYQSTSGLLSVGSSATLTLNSSGQQLEARWNLSTHLPEQLRYLGIFWRRQLQPAEVTIGSGLANIYDTRIDVMGMAIGQAQETKGLNLNWRIALGQGVMQADRAGITQHHEYNLWYLQANIGGQYRHYFAPYWYGLLETGINLEQWQSGAVKPDLIRFKPYYDYQTYLAVGLRYYF